MCALLMALGAFAAAADGTPVALKIDVRAEDLSHAAGANWTSYNGDYSGRRFSALSEITATNLPQLSAAWVFHAHNTNRLENTPVVLNGVMFVTAANDAFALDARTGREIWHHSRVV